MQTIIDRNFLLYKYLDFILKCGTNFVPKNRKILSFWGIMGFLKKLDRLTKWVIGIFISYIIILLFLSHFHELGGYGVETDFYGSYAIEAKRIFKGKHYEDPFHGPGYPFVLGLLNFGFGDMFLTGKILSIISSLLFGFFSFKIFKNLFNSKFAFFVLLLSFIIILPYPVTVSVDMFFAFLISLSIYFLFKKLQFSYLSLFWSGLVAGYAFITRYDAIFLLASIAFSIFLINPDGIRWWQRIKGMLIFSLSFLLSASPWLIANYRQHGNPLYNITYLNIAVNFYGIRGAGITEALKAAAERFDSVFAVISYDPIRFASNFIRNAYRHFNSILFDILRIPLCLLIIPGVLFFLKKTNAKQLTYFTFPLFGFLVLSLAIFHERYYLPFVPCFVFFPVYFIFYYSRSLKRSSLLFVIVAFVIVLLFLLRFSFIKTKKFITSEPKELLQIAQLIRENSSENDIIIARKPHLGYLSHRKTVYFPEVSSVEELLSYARKNKATFVLYSNIETKLRPQLRVLMQPEKLPPELKLFYQWDDPKIFLYKISE